MKDLKHFVVRRHVVQPRRSRASPSSSIGRWKDSSLPRAAARKSGDRAAGFDRRSS